MNFLNRSVTAAQRIFIVALGVMAATVAQAAEPQLRNTWRELGQLNIGRFGCKAQSIDGQRAIVFAGQGDSPGPADSTAEIFNRTTGEWTLTAPMPAGFSPGPNPWTAKLQDGFLVAGGFNAFRTGSRESYIYSVSRDTWIRTGDLPVGATVGSNFGQTDAIVLDDGRVLTAGGLAAVVGETNASLVFTPNYANLALGASGAAVGTWDFTRDLGGSITRLSGPTEHHKLIKLLDGRVLLIVGYDVRFLSNRFGSVFRDTPGVQAELFDPENGTWTPLPNLPAITGEDDRHNGVKGVRQQAAVALLEDGRVLVSGGFSQPANNKGQPLLKEVLYYRASAILFDPALYDIGAYPWVVTSPMRVARDSHVMARLPGSGGIISASGRTYGSWTASAEVYGTNGTWRDVAGLPNVPGSDKSITGPLGCSALMPSGDLLIAGGTVDYESGMRSRRSYLYRP
jgi:hypothetical protein